MKLIIGKSSIILGRKKKIFPVIFSLTAIVMIWTIALSISASQNFLISKMCYQHKEMIMSEMEFNTSITFLEDILISARKPRRGKSIFFHETSCSPDYLVRLNARCVFVSGKWWCGFQMNIPVFYSQTSMCHWIGSQMESKFRRFSVVRITCWLHEKFHTQFSCDRSTHILFKYLHAKCARMVVCKWHTVRQLVDERRIIRFEILDFAYFRLVAISVDVQIWWHLHGSWCSGAEKFRKYRTKFYWRWVIERYSGWCYELRAHRRRTWCGQIMCQVSAKVNNLMKVLIHCHF